MRRYRIPSILVLALLALNLALPVDSLDGVRMPGHVVLPGGDHHPHSPGSAQGHSHGHGHPEQAPDHDHGALVESDACTRPASQRVDDASLASTLAAHSPFALAFGSNEHILAHSPPAIRFETPPSELLGILLI